MSWSTYRGSATHGRPRRTLGVAVVAAVMLMAGCSPLGGETSPVTQVQGPASSNHRISFTFQRSDPLTGVAGDPSQPAVWFWNVTKRADVIYRLDTSGRVKSWAVLTGKRRVYWGLQSGLAVSGRHVWLGVGRTLVRLDPTSGAVRTWTVPAGRADPRAVKPFRHAIPPRITAVAVSPSGQVAVGFDPMSSITTLDPASNHFTVIDLPSVDDLETALAYNNRGTLGVGYSDLAHGGNTDHVLLIAGAHRRRVFVSDSTAWALSAWRSGRFVAGDVDPRIVSVVGPTRALPAPKSLEGTDMPNQSLHTLTGDRLAGKTQSGVIVFPGNAHSDARATARSHLFLTPEQKCYPSSPPPTPSTATATTTTVATSATTVPCREPVDATATDAHNDIWIVTGNNADTVLLLAHA